MNTFVSPREKITVRQFETTAAERLSAELRVPAVIGRILVGRGLTTIDACRTFFTPDLGQLHDPFLLAGMDRAVARIRGAIDKKEKIAVYGDYDVDGITATALLVRVLRCLGADVRYYLPNRITQGYGISADGVQELARQGAGLIVSVDCGVTAVAEVEIARGLGLDFIITDHHEPRGDLPAAVAVLDPKIPGGNYPDDRLAGVGVALKLCQALVSSCGEDPAVWTDLLELAALGTAADIVPMLGENRAIAALGFERLQGTRIIGLAALIEAQKLTGTPLGTHHVVFQLAPCINAVGRLGDPTRCAELLLTDDPGVASLYARELVEANKERRAIHQQVEAEASDWVLMHCDPTTDTAIVAANEGWHVGVIGIVASKLVERFCRPTILFSIEDDGFARGSGRSVNGLHLLETLAECKDLLETFGGHAAAAGMTIKTTNIEAFRMRFNEAVRRRLGSEQPSPLVKADAEVSLGELTPKVLRIINRMEPFGPGNMRPVLLVRNVKNRTAPRVVGAKHLKMTVIESGVVMDAIAFDFGDRISDVRQADNFSLAFSLDENEWNGKVSLQMRVKGVEA